MSEKNLQDLGPDPSPLLVDDDEPFLRRLAKAMEKRGFSVETAGSVAAGRAISTARPPAYAVIDLRLEDGNGLDVVEVLRTKRPDCRVVVLTGYGAIATSDWRPHGNRIVHTTRRDALHGLKAENGPCQSRLTGKRGVGAGGMDFCAI